MSSVPPAGNKGVVPQAVNKGFVAQALLFDQLTTDSEFQNESPNVTIFMNREQLLKSIQKELTDIFNTRSSLLSDVVDALRIGLKKESVLAGIEGLLGLPSARDAFPEGGRDWADFSRKCEMVIRLYEPRILRPCVKIESFDAHSQRLVMTVSGDVEYHNHRENVSFPIYAETS
ncbi:MAG: type VI secretion system baseplate subunit TssE [Holosporales bacterium]|jgi:type VI secretion system lysozyme-like protein|nr:type VI secretion system baseplate subunit TssE [Holosporales bacterium]